MKFRKRVVAFLLIMVSALLFSKIAFASADDFDDVPNATYTAPINP